MTTYSPYRLAVETPVTYRVCLSWSGSVDARVRRTAIMGVKVTRKSADSPALDDSSAETAADLFSLLSSPVRVSILMLLSSSDRRVHELVDYLDMSQPRVSQHLRILRNRGVVRAQRDGREVIYSLRDRHLADLIRSAIAHLDVTSGIRH